MADKEATVFVIDLGTTMGSHDQGRELNNLEWSLQYVWDKINLKVLSARKTDVVGVIGFRTSATDNELSAEEAYHNITVMLPIQQILMPQIRSLHKLLVTQKTNKGDAMSAIIVGLDVIMKYCKRLKYIKNLILITDGHGFVDWSETDEIARQIKAENINLSIFGVDFDDPGFGFKEEDKSPEKEQNEKHFRGLANACEGTFATMAEVIASIEYPRVKKVRPVPSYRGVLTIGDPDQYDDAIAIDVERYPRTKKASAQSATKYVPSQEDQAAGDPASQGTNVALQRTYKFKKDGEEVEVAKEELDKAYLYGRTIVNISDADQNVTKLETTAELGILGFVQKSGFKRYMALSESCCIVGQKGNERAQIALSSLIHALYENELLALARLVTKDGKPPVLIVMAPSIEADIECLVDVQVPFAEDVRHYAFAPLDKVVTMKGKVLTKHRNLPTDEQDKAMSDYVDRMNLTDFQRDYNGNPMEYLSPEDTYSPLLHRINQVIGYRAVHPTDPLPPPIDILTRYSHPPSELIERSENEQKKLIEAFNVKKVPPKKLAKRKKVDEVKPLSGLDIEELLPRGGASQISESSQSKRQKFGIQIGLFDPASDFKQLIDDEEYSWKPVFKEMESVIKTLVTNSFADSSYKKAIQALQAFRSEAIELDEPRQFNDYIRSFKDDLLAGRLGGNRRDFWDLLKKEGVGLITYEESELDQVEDIGIRDAEKVHS